MSEAAVKIADRIYEARRQLRRLLGVAYNDQVLKFMQIVRERSAQHGGDLQAAMKCFELLMKLGHDASAHWCLAAAAELIEPDELTPPMEQAP